MGAFKRGDYDVSVVGSLQVFRHKKTGKYRGVAKSGGKHRAKAWNKDKKAYVHMGSFESTLEAALSSVFSCEEYCLTRNSA